MFIGVFLLLLCLPNSYYSFEDHYHSIEKRGQELILCRKCGADVVDSHYIFTKLSPGARKVEKHNLFSRVNVTVQTLINPFGVHFDIITSERARCKNIGSEQGADSWYPGYTWRICTCPHCGQHLGWTFTSNAKEGKEPTKDDFKSFHGIILKNILGEDCEFKIHCPNYDYRFPDCDAQNIQNVKPDKASSKYFYALIGILDE